MDGTVATGAARIGGLRAFGSGCRAAALSIGADLSTPGTTGAVQSGNEDLRNRFETHGRRKCQARRNHKNVFIHHSKSSAGSELNWSGALQELLALPCQIRLLSLRILAETDQVRKNPICPGNAVRHLTVKSIGVVDINALPVFCINQTTLLGCLPRIVSFDQGFIRRIPTRKELRATLFH